VGNNSRHPASASYGFFLFLLRFPNGLFSLVFQRFQFFHALAGYVVSPSSICLTLLDSPFTVLVAQVKLSDGNRPFPRKSLGRQRSNSRKWFLQIVHAGTPLHHPWL